MKKKTLPQVKVDRQLLLQYKNLMTVFVENMQKVILKSIENDFSTKSIDSSSSLTVNSDEVPNKIKSTFDHIGLLIKLTLPAASNFLRKIFLKMNKANKDRVARGLISKFGIDLSKIIKEKPVQELLQLAVDQNLSLIKTMVDRELQAVKNFVYQQVRTGTFDAKALKDFVIKESGKTEKHAVFIAEDQTHKFNASLTEIRHTALDIHTYYWRNCGDRRVRGNPAGLYPNAKYSHWDREGKMYSYKNPPPDGNPGQPIRCRCYAEAILPDKFNKMLTGKKYV